MRERVVLRSRVGVATRCKPIANRERKRQPLDVAIKLSILQQRGHAVRFGQSLGDGQHHRERVQLRQPLRQPSALFIELELNVAPSDGVAVRDCDPKRLAELLALATHELYSVALRVGVQVARNLANRHACALRDSLHERFADSRCPLVDADSLRHAEPARVALARGHPQSLVERVRDSNNHYS